MKTTRNMVYFILLMFSIGWGQDCDENMYWSSCEMSFYCQPSCYQPYGSENCDLSCEMGCFCNEGYVFSDDTYTECVLLQNCDNYFGDSNLDGELNILDITLLVEFVLEFSYPEYFNLLDIYPDGELNIMDVVMLVDMVLNS